MDRPGSFLTAAVVFALTTTACVGEGPSNAAPTQTVTTTTSASVSTTTGPPPTAPPPPIQRDTGVATVPPGGAPLSLFPAAAPFLTAHEGLVLAVNGIDDGWAEVLTPCDTTAWVPRESIDFEPTSFVEPAGPGFDLTTAVVVIDPGHGGANIGAVGPAGLIENEANLDVARRVERLFGDSHDIDWTTGLVIPGDEYPAVARVLLTRTEGPRGADFEAGLLFRARLATLAGADAFVSIHNNAAPEGPLRTPGSEVFYSISDSESKRLAGILYEELILSFSRFDIDWVGNSDRGARYRLSQRGFIDYYGILRRSNVPTALAEGLFISNAAEEEMLRSTDGQQAYADAVYRGIVRFLTSDDSGSGWSDPIPTSAPIAGVGDAREECIVPPQPGTELR